MNAAPMTWRLVPARLPSRLWRWCAFLVLVAGRESPGQRPLVQELNAELKRRADSGWSGAVVVAHKGTVILRAGFGFADRERQVPFTTSTIAQVGSITKQFTATAVVTLAREGRLKVTDSVAKYLSGVRGAARSITLHELLTHTSGLPQYCGRDFDRATPEMLIAQCLNTAPLTTRGRYAYSNPGYSFLGIIVERVSGLPLDDYLRRKFFEPLRIPGVGYRFASGSGKNVPAICYLNDVPQTPIHERLALLDGAYWHLRGNGGMQASADEMHTWYRALRDGTVIPVDVRKLLAAPHEKRPEAGAYYGYGWTVRVDSAGVATQVSHSGSDGACYAAFVWRPIEDAFFYIVGNNSERDTAAAASALLRIIREQLTGTR